VHFLLEELKISLKSSLSTQSLCHTISPRFGVGVWSPKFSNPGVGVKVRVPQKNQGRRIPGNSRGFNIPLDALYVTDKMIFPANHLTCINNRSSQPIA